MKKNPWLDVCKSCIQRNSSIQVNHEMKWTFKPMMHPRPCLHPIPQQPAQTPAKFDPAHESDPVGIYMTSPWAHVHSVADSCARFPHLVGWWRSHPHWNRIPNHWKYPIEWPLRPNQWLLVSTWNTNEHSWYSKDISGSRTEMNDQQSSSKIATQHPQLKTKPTYRQILSPFSLKHSHGIQWSTAHRDIGQFISRTMRVNGVQMRTLHIITPQYQSSANMTLIPAHTHKPNNEPWIVNKKHFKTHRNNFCFNMVNAVATRHSLPVVNRCNSNWLEIINVVISVSAAVPAPQQYIFGAK